MQQRLLLKTRPSSPLWEAGQALPLQAQAGRADLSQGLRIRGKAGPAQKKPFVIFNNTSLYIFINELCDARGGCIDQLYVDPSQGYLVKIVMFLENTHFGSLLLI